MITLVSPARCRAVALFSVALFVASLGAQVASPTTATRMEAVRVTATKLAAADVEGPQTIERHDNASIRSTGAFSVEEFLASLPPTEEGTRELILIDGRPTFLDPAALPLGLIAAIEISRDGSMPHLGAYASGRIINITLKKNYAGAEVGGKYTATEAGDGHQLTTRLASTASRGKARTIVSIEFTRTAALAALDRDYSRVQDHRARGGRDLRLRWGYPAVIQSVSGTLAGLGSNVALVPIADGSRGGGGAGGFIPGEAALGSGAAGQRRFDTAAYRALIAPSTRASLNLQFTYALTERVQLALSGSHRRTDGRRPGAPPTTPASAETRVPAELNPFRQEVEVGLVHVDFGGTEQRSRAERSQLGAELSGRVGTAWRWEASLGHRRDNSRQRTADLAPALFAAALSTSDPARRFDPFSAAGTRANATLYPSLSDVRRSDTESESSELDLSATGPLARWRGGPVILTLKSELEHIERTRASHRVTGGPLTLSAVSGTAAEGSAAVTLPLVGANNARAGLRRLEAQLAVQQRGATDGEGESHRELGIVWSPVKPLLLRAKYARYGETAAREFAAGAESLVGESLLDPRRGSEALSEVQAITRATGNAEPERTERMSAGFTFEPPALKGLRWTTTYRTRQQHRLLQENLPVQDIINNEAALAGRVSRAVASVEDVQRGRPGSIVAVDITPGNTGEAQRRDLEFALEYRLPERAWGTLRLTASAERALSARYEILPGVPFVQENAGSYRRPRWSGDGLLAWSRNAWSVSARLRHTGAIAATAGAANGISAYTVADLNAGFRWQPRFGNADRKKELRLTVGIGNAFDESPPWADTLNGYRGGSPLGRTYSVAVTLER